LPSKVRISHPTDLKSPLTFLLRAYGSLAPHLNIAIAIAPLLLGKRQENLPYYSTTTKGLFMFIHVAALYSVQPEAADAFIRSIRIGGDWQRVARRVAPDFVASDLLLHQSSLSPVFMCIDFWVTRERYQRVRESPLYEPLFSMHNQMAAATIELGVFAFPGSRRKGRAACAQGTPGRHKQNTGSAMKTPTTIQSAHYVDLELNCPDRFKPGDPDSEIIEIGIVKLDIVSLRIACERDYLVRPHRDISRPARKSPGSQTRISLGIHRTRTSK
jgi:hypothetical protein